MTGDDRPSIVEHLRRILAEPHEDGMTNAEALAREWLKLALSGNATALKEILTRYEAMADPGPKVVKYILERAPGGDWDDIEA